MAPHPHTPCNQHEEAVGFYDAALSLAHTCEGTHGIDDDVYGKLRGLDPTGHPTPTPCSTKIGTNAGKFEKLLQHIDITAAEAVDREIVYRMGGSLAPRSNNSGNSNSNSSSNSNNSSNKSNSKPSKSKQHQNTNILS